jgi:hypothetical protein
MAHDVWEGVAAERAICPVLCSGLVWWLHGMGDFPVFFGSAWL